MLDELTVRWSWSKPNRFFIPALAAANQLFIYRPAHYLKQFHQKYADPEQLKKLIAERCARLDPAVPAQGPAQRLRQSGDADAAALAPGDPAARAALRGRAQPYFHRVDSSGQQLPYIDKFILEIVDGKLIPIKTGAGEVDLQARRLVFKDYTFLRSEPRSGSPRCSGPRHAPPTSRSIPT